MLSTYHWMGWPQTATQYVMPSWSLLPPRSWPRARSTENWRVLQLKLLCPHWMANKDRGGGYTRFGLCYWHVSLHQLPSGRRRVPYRSVNKAKVKAHKSFVHVRTSGLSTDKILNGNDKAAVFESLSKAKAHFENKLVDIISEEPKEFRNYTRHFTRSSFTLDSLEENDETMTDNSTKSEILNEYFPLVLVDEPCWMLCFPNWSPRHSSPQEIFT